MNDGPRTQHQDQQVAAMEIRPGGRMNSSRCVRRLSCKDTAWFERCQAGGSRLPLWSCQGAAAGGLTCVRALVREVC